LHRLLFSPIGNIRSTEESAFEWKWKAIEDGMRAGFSQLETGILRRLLKL
jgi:hypothetical protein